MSVCLRCDFRTDPEDETPPREQLQQHATDAAHPLCGCCGRSLAEHDPQFSCEACLSKAREDLSGIVTMWSELPSHYGPRGTGLDRGTPSAADGKPLPGGDALVLAGPGGVGFAHDHLVHRDTDPPSVAHTLAELEDSWRHARGEPAAIVQGGRGGVSATVRQAAGYLEVHARWAANTHDAFADDADTLRNLHARLEQATGRSQRTEKAHADCFDCAGQLERLITDNGQDDHWTCRRCRRVYTWEAYLLALRARLEEAS